MKNISNQIMLITYADSIGNNLSDLHRIIETYCKGTIGGIHILPFFPSSADRGFAPITYTEVDSQFGTWNDIEELANDYYLMFDYMINHLSAQSNEYKDFVKYKDQSRYHDFFIRYTDFWGNNGEPTQEEVDIIYKRKPRAPYVQVQFADGSSEKIWCTFNEEQIDLNWHSDTVKQFHKENLQFLASKGAALIRLDAFAYATKKAGTSCFFIEPDVWDILGTCKQLLDPSNTEILPEIHEHYSYQKKLAENEYYAYDFALPMLVLHALYTGTSTYLHQWLQICPRKQFTTLDTHDGIGVVDVFDLLPEEEIELTKERLYEIGANVKKKYSSAAYNNLDIYQINCTFYSALGDNDNLYLIARAIQFFTPGIPQVYYVGMLAGKNDIELLEKTKNGRDINRHAYSENEVKAEVNRPVVQKLFKLMKFRNSHPAFNGNCEFLADNPKQLLIQWKHQTSFAKLSIDFTSYTMEILYQDDSTSQDLKVLSL
jgi:sucrose phosphorylase